MDELLQILQSNALESGGRTPARMLGVPADEVKRRVDDYEKQGVIRGYQAILNEDKLQLEKVTAVIEVKVTPQREGGFRHHRATHQPFSRSAGRLPRRVVRTDLLLIVEGRTLREVAAFVSERLSPLDGVLSTSTHFMLKTCLTSGRYWCTREASDERLSSLHVATYQYHGAGHPALGRPRFLRHRHDDARRHQPRYRRTRFRHAVARARIHRVRLGTRRDPLHEQPRLPRIAPRAVQKLRSKNVWCGIQSGKRNPHHGGGQRGAGSFWPFARCSIPATKFFITRPCYVSYQATILFAHGVPVAC